MVVAALAIWTAPLAICRLYVEVDDAANRELVAIALQLLAIAGLFQMADGVQAIAAGALRGYQDTTVPMVLAAVGYWGIGFVGGWALAFPLGHGAVGLWWGLALGLLVVASLLTLRVWACARSAVRNDIMTTPIAEEPKGMSAGRKALR